MSKKPLIKFTIAIVVFSVVLGTFVTNERDLSQYNDIAHDYYVYYLTDYKHTLQALGKQYELNIDYTVGPEFIDEQGRLPPTNGTATQLDDFSIARFAKILPQVLAQYPPEVIKNNVKSIKLSKTLSFYGVGYGGSMVDNIVYLTDSGREAGFTDSYIAQTFHHEFSSVLMKSHVFPTQEWLAANPSEVKYETDIDNYFKSIEQDRDLIGNDYFYQRGVMSKYSYTTLENDFNLFAQTVFNEPQRMKQLVAKYPIIKTKYEILKRFYLSISPKFSTLFAQIG